jgi:predicted ATP-grasp superfamily ATP-dependent carboligase
VVAVTTASGAPSEYTRYAVRKVPRPNLLGSPEAVVDALLAVARTLDEPAVVFPSGDFYLGAISEHREVLAPHFRFPFPERDTLRLVAEKDRFYRFAAEHNIPIPRTFFPSGPDEIAAVAREIAYPCLIKPSVAGVEWRRRGLKILLARTPQELIAQYLMAYAIHPVHIVQEVTPGPDSALHFSLTYADARGTLLAMFTGRKLRQWVPRFGISSMAISEWNPEIDRLTRATLAALRYTGYGSVEFKRHAGTGVLLMTEVTARTWYPHALCEYVGINLPYLAYCDLHGFEPGPLPTGFEDGVKWIDEEGDFRSALYYWREGELSLGEWLRSYRGKKRYAIMAADDLRPAAALGAQLVVRAARLLVRLPVAVARRALRRLSGSA